MREMMSVTAISTARSYLSALMMVIISSIAILLWDIVPFVKVSVSVSGSPISIPLTPEGEVGALIPDYFESKKTKSFHLLTPQHNPQHYPIHELDLDLHEACNLDIKLAWTRVVDSPILSSPVIYPASATSHYKHLFISTYRNFIELIEGHGQKPAGWPITFENSIFQSSPLVYDIDGDGNTDIGVVDRNANMYWIRIGEYGKYLEDYHIQLPKLKVKRDWFELVRVDNAETYNMVSLFDRYRGRDTPPPILPQKQAKVDSLSEKVDSEKSKRKQDEADELGSRRRKKVISGTVEGRRRLTEESAENDQDEPFDIDHGEGDGRFDIDFSKYEAGEGVGEEGGLPFPTDG